MFESGWREAFVVRVWIERQPFEGAQDQMRASVQHVASGETVYVTSYADVASTIEERVARTIAEQGEAD